MKSGSFQTPAHPASQLLLEGEMDTPPGTAPGPGGPQGAGSEASRRRPDIHSPPGLRLETPACTQPGFICWRCAWLRAATILVCELNLHCADFCLVPNETQPSARTSSS